MTTITSNYRCAACGTEETDQTRKVCAACAAEVLQWFHTRPDGENAWTANPDPPQAWSRDSKARSAQSGPEAAPRGSRPEKSAFRASASHQARVPQGPTAQQTRVPAVPTLTMASPDTIALQVELIRLEALAPSLKRVEGVVLTLVSRARAQDHRGVLQNARVVAEALMRELYTEEVGESPAMKTLGDLIKPFTRPERAGVVPREIMHFLNGVMAAGNLGAHDHADSLDGPPAQMGADHALSAVTNLLGFAEWYATKYRHHEVPGPVMAAAGTSSSMPLVPVRATEAAPADGPPISSGSQALEGATAVGPEAVAATASLSRPLLLAAALTGSALLGGTLYLATTGAEELGPSGAGFLSDALASGATSRTVELAASGSVAPGVASAIPAAEVRGLVDAWLAAQNDGRFADYERLYASGFVGIKRAGPRERSFERDGWLKDRRAMFSRAMKVSAADLVITPSAGSATANFTQTWESGTFRDIGPKQLVVVREGGRLRIAREEMLASELVGADGTDATPPGEAEAATPAAPGTSLSPW
jgi:hypothetical protein